MQESTAVRAANNQTRFWNRFARRYAAHKIGDPAGFERSLACVARYIAGKDRVLEIGCGTGTVALRLAPLVGQFLATDISANMIAIAEEKAAVAEAANLSFSVTTLDTLDAAPATFDAVLAFSMLHLLPNRTSAFARIRSLLKPGGLFISKTPCVAELGLHYQLLIPLMRMVGLAPRFEKMNGEDLAREIAAAGFEVVETARHGSGKTDLRLFLAARRPLAD